jgi:superfamily I DNA/RNA helicase
MWEIYEKYKELRRSSGYPYDVDDVATAVATEFDRDSSPRLYRHIIVDEGQDLSPEMLRSLAKAIPADGSLTFFGDVAQQIYGHRMSWRSAGIRVSKIWEFKENYRNTQQIAALGLAISQMPYYAGAPDMVAPVRPTAAGPKPTLVYCADEATELAIVKQQAQEASKRRTVGVLVRTLAQARKLKEILPPDSVSLKTEMNLWKADPGVYYGTYHSGKGLEFDMVILPFLSDQEMPDPEFIEHFGLEEASAWHGRLLYVGVTRARSALVLTHTGNPK